MFGKKQKKLDSRIRYQHTGFTRKLDQARHYKREAKAVENDLPLFEILPKIGLKSKHSQILAGLLLGGLVYLVFVPNFLAAKNIIIEGVDSDKISQVEAAVEFYISKAPFYDPQHNIIFLNKTKLREALLSDPQIYKVNSIKKSWLKRSVTVSAELKRQQFVVLRNNQIYSIYNDGSVQDEIRPQSKVTNNVNNIDEVKSGVDSGQEQTVNIDNGDKTVEQEWVALLPGAIKIKDQTPISLSAADNYLSEELVNQLNYIQANFKQIVLRDVDYYEIPAVTKDLPPVEGRADEQGVIEITPEPPYVNELPLRPGDLHIYARKGIPDYKGAFPNFKIVLDTTKDIPDTLAKLQLLLSQTAPDRYNKLVYIDMRFENRGFVCLAGTPCAIEGTLPAN